MRKIFHLEIKSERYHKYYGSLSALCSENPNLGVSKFTLDRFDFSEPFENGICIIRKSVMKTTGSVGEKMTLIKLGKHVFKHDKRIVADTTMEQYLSGWNIGNFDSKQPTVMHIAIIAKVTGYPICDLIHVED